MSTGKRNQKTNNVFTLRKASLLLLLLFISLGVYAGGKWELKKNSDGIAVYTKDSENSNIKSLKAVFTAKGTPLQLAAVLLDIDGQKDWVYSTKSATVLKRISTNELVYHSEKSMPWPLSNRHAVMRVKVNHDAGGNVAVRVTTVNGLVPVKKNIVRVPASEVAWKIIPIDANTMKIEYEASVDPGGSIPAAVTNMFITKGPLESFKKLREILAKQNTQQVVRK